MWFSEQLPAVTTAYATERNADRLRSLLANEAPDEQKLHCALVPGSANALRS